MTLQTTYSDRLVTLFADWCPFVYLLSLTACNIYIKMPDDVKLAVDEIDIKANKEAKLALKRQDMHFFYKIREQLRDCISELNKEVEANLLDMSRDQHDIIYLRKLASIHNEIKVFLNNDYNNLLARFEGIVYEIESPKAPVLRKTKDSNGVEMEYFDEPIDPYWNEYLLEEQFVIEGEPPILIKLITIIAEEFGKAAAIIQEAIKQSLVHKQHPELIQLAVSEPTAQHIPPPETAPVDDNQNLTAVQKLLFIRLLQITGLFPKKPANTDDAPELRAIALLTGISYENQIKGINGANVKVNLLVDNLERSKMTKKQAKYKLKDLEAVEKVAQLLHVQVVLSLIDKYRKELMEIVTNR